MTRAVDTKAVQYSADKPSNAIFSSAGVPFERSLVERFERIVRRQPDRIAVKTGGVAVTYAELNAMSNRVARSILAARSGDPEPIALLFATGVAQVAAVWGVLKAGKFFVLLDASFPKDRIALVLRLPCRSFNGGRAKYFS